MTYITTPTTTKRENATQKAHRLLTEGRLVVRSIEPQKITAECRGDSGQIYHVGWDMRPYITGPGWRCNCPAHGRRCSHIQALQLVVVVGD